MCVCVCKRERELDDDDDNDDDDNCDSCCCVVMFICSDKLVTLQFTVMDSTLPISRSLDMRCDVMSKLITVFSFCS